MRRFALLLVDLALIGLATLLAQLLRDNFELMPVNIVGLSPYLTITLLTAIPVLTLLGIDRSIWRFSAMSDYLRVAGAAVAIMALAVAGTFAFNRLDGLARSLPVLQLLLMTVGLVGARVLMRLRHAHRSSGVAHVAASPQLSVQESVLVLGLNAVAELYLRAVAELASDRIKIVGLVGRSEQHRGREIQTFPVLGLPEEIVSIVETLRVHGVSTDRIVITTAYESLSAEARHALLEIERSSNIQLDFFAARIAPPAPREPAKAPAPAAANETSPRLAFNLDEHELEAIARRPYWRIKRVLDTLVAAALLLIVAPLLMALAAVVVLDVGFPAVFWQQRPGRGGVAFRLYKLRTMAQAHDAQGRRIPDDLRLSKIGRFVRRTRLDELPQLLSILVGDMSFVGPRPLLPVDQDPAFAARLLVRPGLTGWAQVMGGRAITPADKAALDIWYIRNASLRLDIQILARTVPMVVLGEVINDAAVRDSWHDLRSARNCAGDGFGGGGGHEIKPASRPQTLPIDAGASAGFVPLS